MFFIIINKYYLIYTYIKDKKIYCQNKKYIVKIKNILSK